MNLPKQTQKGTTIATVLIILIITSIFISTAVSVVYLNLNLVIKNENSQKAFNIAEAGINYYLWHMSHNNTDFTDDHIGDSVKTSGQFAGFYGPYIHRYYNSDGQDIGQYSLYIKPKGDGSSIAVVRSVGESRGAFRTLEAEIGGPSWSRYGIAANVPLWFGPTETADGPVFSNVGIRMDGPSNSYVKSARATYGGYASLGASGSNYPGVWCSSSVTTPVNCNTRNKSLWIYPDSSPPSFSTITAKLCDLKKIAFDSDASTKDLLSSPTVCNDTPALNTNAYIQRYAAAIDSKKGYLITLNNDGTYNRQRVDNEVYSGSSTRSYTSALTLSGGVNNIPLPESKVIFVEDNVWVRTNPTFKSKVTIVAARLDTSDTQKAKMVIADNLAYDDKSGKYSIGLVSENYVVVAPYAPSNQQNGAAFNLEIDAAIIAKDGYVRAPDSYLGNDVPAWTQPNQTLSFYGSIVMGGNNASSDFWTWLYTSGGTPVDGYKYNTTRYDPNLLYAPPPSFPVSGSYNILKWREILTTP